LIISIYSRRSSIGYLFLGIFSGIIFIILGTFVVSEGIVIVYSGAYGFQFTNSSTNITSQVYGIATSTTTYQNIFTDFIGFGYWILGLGSFIISAITNLKKQAEEVED